MIFTLAAVDVITIRGLLFDLVDNVINSEGLVFAV